MAYWDACVEDGDDAWRRGKPQTKLREIDRSLLWDTIQAWVAKAHIKQEVLIMYPSKARMIQAYCNDATSYCLAHKYRWLAKAVKQVTATQRVLHGMDTLILSASGLNHPEIGAKFSEWMADPGFLLVESDGRNWDASMQEAHLNRKVEVYKWLDDELGEHAAAFIRFKGRVYLGEKYQMYDKGYVVYAGVGTVKSGAQDTTTGNVLIRWEQYINALLQLPVRPTKVRGMILGDDILLLVWGISADGLSAALRAAEARMGVDAKVGVLKDPCQCVFLSATFVPCGPEYKFVPLPGRIFAKLFWTVIKVPEKRLDSYRGQVAEPFLKAYRGWYLMETFLRAHVRPARPGQKKWVLHGTRNMTAEKPLTDDRVGDWGDFLERRYGLVITHLDSTLQQLRDYDPTRALILNDPFIREMISNDCCDVTERHGCF